MRHRPSAAAKFALLAALAAAPLVTCANSTTRPSVTDLITQLSSTDPATRAAGVAALNDWPPDQFPALESAAKRDDLSPAAAETLSGFLAREAPRALARQRLRRRAEQTVASNNAALLASYDRVGHRDPKWDADARAAFTAFSNPPVSRDGQLARLSKFDALYRRAYDAGCRDPQLRYYAARAAGIQVTKPDPGRYAAIAKEMAAAVDDLDKSEYPALRKCFAHARCVELLVAWKLWRNAPDQQDPVAEHLSRAIALWPAAVADDSATDDVLSDLAAAIEAGWTAVTAGNDKVGDRGELCEFLVPPWRAARPKDPGPLVFKGRVYVTYAWDARGGGWANTVTPDGWAKMAQRLAVAEADLTAAFDLDPTDPRAPTEMIRVELGQGKGRDVMEKWFARAMANNPDNYAACTAKLYYLEPKWHGSVEDMLAFGRECLATGNYTGRVAFLLVDAHYSAARYHQDPREYYRDPAVWRDIQSVYVPYLDQHPGGATYDRSYYAYYAALCGQWAEADRQFTLLGDNPELQPFGTRENYDRLRRAAAEAR